MELQSHHSAQGFFSRWAFSFTTSSSFYTLLLHSCTISSNGVSSSAKYKSLIPSAFPFCLILLGGDGFRVTSFKVLAGCDVINFFLNITISSPARAYILYDTRQSSDPSIKFVMNSDLSSL